MLLTSPKIYLHFWSKCNIVSLKTFTSNVLGRPDHCITHSLILVTASPNLYLLFIYVISKIFPLLVLFLYSNCQKELWNQEACVPILVAPLPSFLCDIRYRLLLTSLAKVFIHLSGTPFPNCICSVTVRVK